MSDDPTTPFGHLPPPPPPPPPPAGPPPGAPTIVRTGPTLNAAWLAVGSLAAIFGLVFGTLQVVGTIAHEEHDETFRVDDPAVAVLDVSSHGGRIEVIGADVDAVQVEAHVSEGMLDTQLTHEVVGDRLQIRVRCRGIVLDQWCSADLRIVIPRDLEVKVRSRQDTVVLRTLEGRVDAESGNGTVEGESLSGPSRLKSRNGSVRGSRLRTASLIADSDNGSVRLEFAIAPTSAIVHSDNGTVDIAVPRGDEGYAVDIDSDNGATDNLVRADPDSERRIVASSTNGSVTVRYLD